MLIAAKGINSFPQVGSIFLRKSHSSPAIDKSFHAVTSIGFDGQFYFAIALDPARAYHYMDSPVYRYSRILYPAVVRLVAFGDPRLTPAAMILVNLAAVVAGTYFVALLLERKGLSPLLAGFYFLFPGMLVAFSRDLTDPLAYALVAAGLLVLDDWRNPRRIWLAAIVFAAAGLARETTFLIPLTLAAVAFATAQDRRRQLPTVLVFGLVVVLPYLLWRGFLDYWLGSFSDGPSLVSGPVPFSGAPPIRPICLLAVMIPVILLLFVGLTGLRRNWRQGTFTALVLSLIVFGLYLPSATYAFYFDAGRLQIGAVMLGLISLGSLRRDWLSTRLMTIAWMLAYAALIPLAAVPFIKAVAF